MDCKGAGVAIVAPLEEVTTLTGHSAERWQMLAAHVDAGHRLRRGLAAQADCDKPQTELPYSAEAIFDGNSFRITEAVGQAQERTETKKLREAAVTVDRARGKMRSSDPDKALKTWKASCAVDGPWSIGSTPTADVSFWPFQTPPVCPTLAGSASAKAKS